MFLWFMGEQGGAQSEGITSKVETIFHVPIKGLSVMVTEGQDFTAREGIENVLEGVESVEDHVAQVDQ